MPYGIANARGQVPGAEVRSILALAAASGVDCLDTAVVYGESERALGACDLGAFRITTKLPPLPSDDVDVGAWVMGQARESCARLGVERLHGLLLHRADDATGPRGAEVMSALRAVREAAVTTGVGISIYDPGQLEGVDLRDIDLVQAPFNVLDRRLCDSGALSRLADAGVEVHARSALLQGVLMMNPEAIPDRIAGLRESVAGFGEWAAQRGVSLLAAALGHVLATPGIARVVLGVDSIDQFREGLEAEGAVHEPAPAELAVPDPTLVDPSRWS